VTETKKLKKLFERKREETPDYVRKLVGGFEYRIYWYELIECARKLLLVGAPVFFDPPGSMQIIYGLLVCFLTFGANAWFQPYSDPTDDQLASLCQLVIFFSLLASVIDSFDDSTLRTNYNMDVLPVVFTLVSLVASFLNESASFIPNAATAVQLLPQEMTHSQVANWLQDKR
jgi:hypothetical protein